ncbi:helix-turn-helix domain-containing protein [Streptomyces sp. NPDC015661]|uniref:MmyB family transcriptional regulator n=1 Tax=Streptomyces sp. NPDC015661 TaxID=3364961 RepID=UPI0036F6985F
MRIDTSERAALKRVLQARRAAIDPLAKGFVRRSAGPGRRAAGLSQEQMDELLLRARGTYNRFENGQLDRPCADLLASVAKILELSEQEWTLLWRLTRKEEPPGTLHGSTGMSVAGMWGRLIEGVGGAVAYISDAAFGIVAHNEEFVRLFPPGRAPRNIMRYLLLDTRARTETLIDWETRWVPEMLTHFKHAVVRRPEDSALGRLEQDVLADPVTGPLYRACDPVPLSYTDGAALPVRHALHGPGHLTTCLAEPLTAPGAVINLSVYTPDPPA